MPQTATNPKTGERIALVGGQWVPVTKTATNPKTGEQIGLAGNSWVTIKAPPAAAPAEKAKKFAPSPIEEIPVVGGALSGIADIPLGFMTGAATIGKTFSDLAGADNAVSRGIADFGKSAEELQSAEAREDAARDAAEMAKAEGFFESVGAAGKAFLRHPLDVTANLLGTAAPFVAAAASGAGLPALGALGAASGVGMVKGDIYDATLARAKQAGMSDAQAKKIAGEAQSYGGKNIDMIALGGVIGGIANATGAGPALGKWLGGTVARDLAEQAAARAAAKAAGQEVTEEAGKGLLRRTAEGAVIEALPEGIQAGQERLAQNLAQERAGFPTDTWKGVLEQAAYEGTLGGILGGGISAAAGRRPITDERQARIDEEERRATEFDAASGEVGKAYNDAVARYKSEGMSDREAILKAREDVNTFMAERRKVNEPSTADTTDTGGTEPSVSGDLRVGTPGMAGRAGEAVDGSVGDGGAPAGADIGVERAQQPPLKKATAKEVTAALPTIEQAFADAAIDFEDTYGVTDLNAVQKRQAAKIILESPEVGAYDAITTVLDRGMELRGETKKAPAAAPKIDLTPETYVDRYLAGEGRGNSAADLELQQYAANFASEIEAEFARRSAPIAEDLAKAPVADAIKAATQPDPASVVPGIAETAAKDLGIETQPVTEEPVVAEPAPIVADTATVENVAPAVEEAPAPTYTPQEIYDNLTYFGGQEAQNRGYADNTPEASMFREGVRDSKRDIEPIADELILNAPGPNRQQVLDAYKAGLQWGSERIAEAQAAPVVEAAPEPAPVVEAAPEPAPVVEAAPEPVEVAPEEELEEAPEDKEAKLAAEIDRAGLGYYDEDTEEQVKPSITKAAYNALKFKLKTKRGTLEEIENDLDEAIGANSYQASRSGKAAIGMDVDTLTGHIKNLTKNWRAKIGIKVIGTIDELPAKLRRAVERDGMEGVPAFVSPDGTIYFIANNSDTLEDANSAVYHEALGHLGLRALFNTRLNDVLSKIYSGNKSLREQADQWLTENPGVYANDSNPTLRALEEVLAEQSENGRIDANIWAKITAIIKEFGRRIGMTMGYSDAEVRTILALAHDRVIDDNRESAVIKGLRYMAGFDRTNQVESETSEQPSFMAGSAKKKGETATVARLKRKLEDSHYAAEMSGTAGDMFFQSRGSKRQIDMLDSAWKAMTNKGRRFVIGYLYYSRDVLRAIRKLSPPVARKLGFVDELMHRMNGFRNIGLKALTYNALRYSKFNAKFKEGGKLLSDLINGSTLASVDPRHKSLAAALAADPKLIELVKEGASDTRINNRKAMVEFIYGMYEKLGTTEMGNGEGQRIYEMVMGGFERSFENEYQAIIANLRQSGLPKDRIAQGIKQINEMYEAAKKNAPYAPLFRAGQYWVRVGKGKNRRVFRFDSETLHQQGIKDAIQWLQEEKGDKRTAAEIKADESVFTFGQDIEGLEADFMRSEPSDVLKNVLQEVDKGNLADGAAIKDMIFQLYAASLPKGTLYEKMQHRQGISGFSADTLRSYVDAQMATINRLTHLKYATKIRKTVGEAYGLMAGNPNREQLQPYIDEMAIRVAETFSPDISKLDPLARLANKATFFYLLTSLKSAMVQFLQLPTVALPAYGARYGYAQTAAVAARYIATIGNKFGTSKVDEDGNLVTNWGQPTMGDSKYITENKDPEMKEALMYAWSDARERGILDTTYAGELVDRKSEPSVQYKSRPARMSKWVFDFMAGGIHHAERIAREIAYMSAFELDYNMRRKEGMDHKTAMAVAADAAADLTLETMFDFAESSKPRAMKGPIGRVALQFFSFPIQMASMLTRSFLGTVTLLPNKERKIAAKQFFGTLGMTWMFAGATGMPGYSFMMGLMTSLLAAAGLADDDDDEDGNNPLTSRNLDLWFREKFLPEYFGPDSDLANDLGLDKEQAQELTRAIKMGPISAATNLNFGSSVGLDGLFFRDDTPVDTNEEAMRSLWYTLSLGAFGSVLRNFVRGGDYMMKGDWQRAAENITPAPVRNALVAKRLASEGYVTPSTQDVVAPVEEYTWGKLVGQGIGFGRTDIADIQKSNLLAKRTVDKIEKERSQYLDKLDKAYRDVTLKRTDMAEGQKNINAVWKDIFKWNDETDFINPIFLDNWEDSIETRAEDRARAMKGLRVPQKYDPYVRGIVEKNR